VGNTPVRTGKVSSCTLMHTNTHTHTHTHTHSYIRTHIHTSHTITNTHRHRYTQTRMHARTHTQTGTRADAHTDTHIHTHTHTHVHTQTHTSFFYTCLSTQASKLPPRKAHTRTRMHALCLLLKHLPSIALEASLSKHASDTALLSTLELAFTLHSFYYMF